MWPSTHSPKKQKPLEGWCHTRALLKLIYPKTSHQKWNYTYGARWLITERKDFSLSWRSAYLPREDYLGIQSPPSSIHIFLKILPHQAPHPVMQPFRDYSRPEWRFHKHWDPSEQKPSPKTVSPLYSSHGSQHCKDSAWPSTEVLSYIFEEVKPIIHI